MLNFRQTFRALRAMRLALCLPRGIGGNSTGALCFFIGVSIPEFSPREMPAPLNVLFLFNWGHFFAISPGP